MKRSEETKQRILHIAGNLFNTHGYRATSISDITFASGFTKGAIYKHFENKAELEQEALKDMSRRITEDMRLRVIAQDNAVDKLVSIFRFYTAYVTNPIIPGGCPILNAAIESDDSSPALRSIANETMEVLHRSVAHILRNGKRFNQLKDIFDEEDFATLIISSFEGAIMMSKLTGDNKYLKQVFNQLESILEQYSIK